MVVEFDGDTKRLTLSAKTKAERETLQRIDQTNLAGGTDSSGDPMRIDVLYIFLDPDKQKAKKVIRNEGNSLN